MGEVKLTDSRSGDGIADGAALTRIAKHKAMPQTSNLVGVFMMKGACNI